MNFIYMLFISALVFSIMGCINNNIDYYSVLTLKKCRK